MNEANTPEYEGIKTEATPCNQSELIEPLGVKQPIQPLITDQHGTLRFKENAIVRYLLDNGGVNLNDLARIEFSQDDRMQFAQLIGYSLSGFADLSYVDDATFEAATAMAEQGMNYKDARIATLAEKLDSLKQALREPIAELFGVHPDDLNP